MFEIKKNDVGRTVLVIENYTDVELIEVIGQGAFCKVWSAIGTYQNVFDEDGTTKLKVPYAVKVYDRLNLKNKKICI